MKNIIKKLAEAKIYVSNTKMEKAGNGYGYTYFTPSQIEILVKEICEDQKILTKFDLIRNELGVYGELSIFDLESDDSISFKMATAIPEIKATNIAQQLGGCVTYTERYLKMSAFGIVDNSLDFDAKNNSDEKKETKKYSLKSEPSKYVKTQQEDINKDLYINSLLNKAKSVGIEEHHILVAFKEDKTGEVNVFTYGNGGIDEV